MSRKSLIYIGLTAGSIIGAYIPSLWGGGGIFSVTSLIFSSIGALLGIFIAMKMTGGW